MAIHNISNGSDTGLALYNGGSTPINFVELWLCTSGNGSAPATWVELSQLWRCTAANFITGVFSWVQFIATDKYRPAAVPQSVSATAGTLPGRPTTVRWTEDTTHTPPGVDYALQIVPHNLTQGTQDATINLPVGRSGTSDLYATPGGWNSGDEIYFDLFYVDASGYTGPFATTSFVFLP